MMQLFVRNLNDKTVLLDVASNDTIGGVKAKLQEREGVPAIEQRLLHSGRQLADNGWTLADYNISPESTLLLLLPLRGGFHIFVKTLDGKTIRVEVDSDDTIWNVKKKIEGRIGISADEQSLIYTTKPLPDNTKIKDHNIYKETTFHLIQRLPGGETFQYLLE